LGHHDNDPQRLRVERNRAHESCRELESINHNLRNQNSALEDRVMRLQKEVRRTKEELAIWRDHLYHSDSQTAREYSRRTGWLYG
jgi:predicted RNase H-like nuclease (RuvC/YqgF family)